MAVATLTGIPDQAECGNQISFTESFADFPVATWTAQLVLSKAGSRKSFDAAVSGSLFLFTIASTDSAKLEAGDYDYAIYVSSGGERTTAKTGIISFLPDLAGNIPKSFSQRMVEKLQTCIEQLARGTNLSVNFNGQSFTKKDIKMLNDILLQYEAAVAREGRDRGTPQPKVIAPEFIRT